MRIEILNRIKRFADDPSEGELAAIIDQFDSEIEEEFFWISIANQNKQTIFDLINAFDTNYFSSKLGVLSDEKEYNQIHFRILRYLIEISKVIDKSSSSFEALNAIVVNLIKVLGDDLFRGHSQIRFFISEIILELPLKYIESVHISFLNVFSLASDISYIGASLVEQFVPRIIKEENGALLFEVLDKLIFGLKEEIDKENYQGIRFDGYNFTRLLTPEIIRSFILLVGSEKLMDFTVKKVVSVATRIPYNFSHLSISTIEDSSQILDKNKFEFVLVKFLRMQLEVQQIKETLLDSFLKSEFGVLHRLAVYYLNTNYSASRNYFWSICSPHFLFNTEIKHELFMLFKENADEINLEEATRLIEYLNEMRDIVINESLSKDEIIYYNSLLAKEYLLAFKDCKTEIKNIIDKELERVSKVVTVKISNPGYNIYFDQSIAYDKDREEYSATFNFSDLPYFLDVVESGFKDTSDSEALKIINRINYILRNNLALVLENQEQLIKIGFENFNEVPNFFEKAWFDKVEINWKEVFSFFGRVIDSNYKKNPKSYDHFISYCAWLIRAATKDDSYALDGENLEEAKNLCLKFLKLNIQSERYNKDPFFDILNSTDGKIFDATLEVLLRNARLNKKEDSDRWYPDIKQYYSSVLENGQQEDAIIWSLTMHLPQFGFLEMKWLKDHINQMFPIERMELWFLAMRGYHKYCSQVYKVIYDLLLENGHYELALAKFVDDVHGTDDVYKHIVMAYVADWPGSELKNPLSLIYKTLQKGNRSQINGLIRFFLENKTFPVSKMLAMWRAILNSPAVNNPLVYNDLLLLFSNLKNVDAESFELIKITLGNITTNQVLYRLLHSLFEMENADPVFRAKILMEINEPNFQFFHDQGGFEKLAIQVINIDRTFGKVFLERMIEKRLYHLLEIYNKIA